MPQTRFQGVSFGVLMSVFMAYGMELYNVSIKVGGMRNDVFVLALKEAAFMCIIVFVLSTMFGNKVGHRLAFKHVNPQKDNPFFITIMVSCCTVAIMCPSMSLVATIIFTGVDAQFIANWFATIIKNFPMALLWQLFFAGPMVRLLFGLIFKKQLIQKESCSLTSVE